MAKTKTFKCREKAEGCLSPYEKWTSNIQLQACCTNRNCIMQKTEKVRDKREATERRKSKRERKEGLQALRTIAGWCFNARQTGFNPWVRQRDKEDGCIVCGSKTKSSYHAGHFMSVGSRPELQFHPDNCHKQCAGCNQSVASVSSKYRANLVKKIGVARVEYLENYHAVTKWTVEEIKEIKNHYQQLTKGLRDE